MTPERSARSAKPKPKSKPNSNRNPRTVFTGFIESFRSKWRVAHLSAPPASRSKNGAPTSRAGPQNKPTRLLRRSEPEEEAAARNEGCPAPVCSSNRLARDVTILAPQGQPQPQRRAAGLEPGRKARELRATPGLRRPAVPRTAPRTLARPDALHERDLRHPRARDPRLARQPDGRGRRRPRAGARGRAAVPSGASTGEHEAVELRDGGEAWAARASRARSSNVNGEIAPALIGARAADQGASTAT